MRGEDAIRIDHMIEAAEVRARFGAGRGRDEFEADLMLRFALLRAIEIIGEAASRLSIEARGAAPSIPWQAIVAMRNRLIHAYFDVDPDVLRKAATEKIPSLLVALHAVSRNTRARSWTRPAIEFRPVIAGIKSRAAGLSLDPPPGPRR